MAKPSSVNFINKSDQTVRIRSADNRFDAFNLAPGEEVRKTDSVTGSGNYDINADILINPAGPNNSECIGNFKFDNPALKSSNVRSDVFMYQDGPWYRSDSDDPGSLDWGFVSRSNFRKMDPSKSERLENFYDWPEKSTPPFEPGYKISTTDFGTGGPNGDQKRWDLVIVQLPPV